jgi:hypothetical protein
MLTLLSLLGGGLMRLMPEIMGFFNKRTDNSHELAMLDRQVVLEKEKSASRLAELAAIANNDAAAAAAAMSRESAQHDSDQTLALLAAQKEALAGQMQKIGIWWVDALNFLVRPATTYYVLAMYGAAKVAMFMVAMKSGLGGWEAILKIYDEEDRAILSGILAFWFTDRVIIKNK